jgi:AraC-like DNA-binding protein
LPDILACAKLELVDLPPSDPPSFPVAHVHHLVDLVKRWGVSSDDLLAGTGVAKETLADIQARLPVPTMVGLFERARTLTREPAIGLHIGLAIRPTLYGNLGFAFMSASNIRESIDLAIRFSPIVTTSLRFRLRVEGRAAAIVVDELADFGSARDIVVLAVLVSLRQIGAILAGRDLTTSAAEIALPEPWYAGKLAEANLSMRFDCPSHRLVFDARSLDVPYGMANPTALHVARAHCQQELDQFGAPTRWADSVRGLLARSERRFRSLEDVATTLHQSTRTLKRRLAAEGVSFSALRDDELRERATTLVRSSLLTYAEIAARLGYSNVTSFDRAFRRWTSATPVEFRRAASRSSASRSTQVSGSSWRKVHSPAPARDRAPTTK